MAPWPALAPDAAVVVIGAGQAGAAGAMALRGAGHVGPITLIGGETEAPYQRPPLSKKFLTGEAAAPQLVLHKVEALIAQGIDVRLGSRVQKVDREARHVLTEAGERFPYDHAIIATGARTRELPVEHFGARAFSLRSWADAEALRSGLEVASSVLVIGAGLIGLEVAASARTLGKSVVVLEGAQRIMPQHVSGAVAEHLHRVHASRGVEIHCATLVETLLADPETGQVIGARTSRGDFSADLVVDAVGVLPETGIAEEAGLDVDRAIVVDPWLRTSDRAISAIGDCAVVVAEGGGRQHVESVQNATDQGLYLGHLLAGDTTAAYAATPWFWSDQFGTRVQMVGLPRPRQIEVVGPGAEKFSVYCFTDGVLNRVESIAMAGEHLAARKVLASGRSPELDEARTEEFSLKKWWSRNAQLAAVTKG